MRFISGGFFGVLVIVTLTLGQNSSVPTSVPTSANPTISPPTTIPIQTTTLSQTTTPSQTTTLAQITVPSQTTTSPTTTPPSTTTSLQTKTVSLNMTLSHTPSLSPNTTLSQTSSVSSNTTSSQAPTQLQPNLTTTSNLTTVSSPNCSTPNSLSNSICNGHGTCVNGSCLCQNTYADTTCSYRRKYKWLAFGLGWLCLVDACGVDRFYLGYIGIGIAKLALGLSWIPLASLKLLKIVCLLGSEAEIGTVIAIEACFITLTIVGMSAAAVWFIVDLILIGTGHLSDAHGYALY